MHHTLHGAYPLSYPLPPYGFVKLRKASGTEVRHMHIEILALFIVTCLMLGKGLYFFESQFVHLQNDMNSTYHIELWAFGGDRSTVPGA